MHRLPVVDMVHTVKYLFYIDWIFAATSICDTHACKPRQVGAWAHQQSSGFKFAMRMADFMCRLLWLVHLFIFCVHDNYVTKLFVLVVFCRSTWSNWSYRCGTDLY